MKNLKFDVVLFDQGHVFPFSLVGMLYKSSTVLSNYLYSPAELVSFRIARASASLASFFAKLVMATLIKQCGTQ